MVAKDANQSSKLRAAMLSAQFEASRTWMGAEPLPAPEPPTAPGVSTPGLENACLNEDITLDEMCSCIKPLQRGKGSGIMALYGHDQRWWRPCERVLVVAVQLHSCQPLP